MVRGGARSALLAVALPFACRGAELTPSGRANYRASSDATTAAVPQEPALARVPQRPASTTPRATGEATSTLVTPPAEFASQLPPLEVAAPLIPLQVPGFRDAMVAVPTGAHEPRPVVLALHGNFDRPEWQCEVMRGITNGYPFVLCPRGIPRRDVPRSWDRWEYGGVARVTEEIEAGLAALRARFDKYVAEGPVVFTGFSLGAILGRAIVRKSPARFPRVLFTEGGNEGWDFRHFQEQGGVRVLFGCAQPGCPQRCRALVKQAARFGVELRVADGGNVGHTYDGPVAQAIRAEWAWLVDGDRNWSSFAEPSAPGQPEPVASAKAH